MSNLLQKTKVPEGKAGDWYVERFDITKEQADTDALRNLFSFTYSRKVEPGTYTRLVCKGRGVVMSDTPAELNDHWEPVYKANGHCLINGLGLGIVIEACLRKEEVEHVHVVEESEEVIRLVGPYLLEKWGADRLTIHNADAFTFKPDTNLRFGMVWHDIWDTICADNLPEMHRLHRRYGRKADWQGSWCRSLCERNR